MISPKLSPPISITLCAGEEEMSEVLVCLWGWETMRSMRSVETLLYDVRDETPLRLAAALVYCSQRAELFSTTSSSAIITHTLSGMADQEHFCPVS